MITATLHPAKAVNTVPAVDAGGLAARWARVGVAFNVKPAVSTPDLETLLLDTVKACPGNARLFILAVTWLAEFGLYVAAHRLKGRAIAELAPRDQATLGLLLDTAVEHGAPRSLRHIVVDVLAIAPVAEPLFEVDRGGLASLIELEATPASKHWGHWVQPIELKPDALRTAEWVVGRNPGLCWRAAHKGDLRCSVAEILRRDVEGQPVSESELARRCGATLAAVRTALADLTYELPGLDIARQRGRYGSQIQLI